MYYVAFTIIIKSYTFGADIHLYATYKSDYIVNVLHYITQMYAQLYL